MRVLGVDPSLNSTGWAVIDYKDSKFVFLGGGVIKHSPGNDHIIKVFETAKQIGDIVQSSCIDAVAMEQTIVNVNPGSSLKLGMVRGAVFFACLNLGKDVKEYTPKTIKSAIVGNGNAKKEQVEFMVSVILGDVAQSTKFQTLDVSDAIATAITHVLSSGARTR
jgi:crossover junction endodeoxyribonuclease RuvC